MNRRDLLKAISAVGAALFPATARPTHKSSTKRLILDAVRQSSFFTVVNEDLVRGPGWRDFKWDEKHQAFVSTTWDGHVGYHWMLAVINGLITQIPAAFAQVGQWREL